MKNIINVLLVFLLLFTFISCKKEPPVADNPSFISGTKNVNPIGITWELYSGQVFIENMDTRDLKYYDHFGVNKNTSNLNIFELSTLPFDIISKGITTWKFTSSKEFIINNNNTYQYTVNSLGIFNLYGNEIGSGRNIEVLKSTEEYLIVKLNTQYGNDGVNNYRFYNVLIFVKQSVIATPVNNSVPNGYQYSGVIGNQQQNPVTLSGQNWVVKGYGTAFGNMTNNLTDVINFTSSFEYTINNDGIVRKYVLQSSFGSNSYNLILYDCDVLGGSYSGFIIKTFNQTGVINNAQFVDVFLNKPKIYVWMERL
jgi:hypothetical protein